MIQAARVPFVLAVFALAVSINASAPGQDDATPGESAKDVRIDLSPAFPRLRFERPVYFGHADDGTNNCYVIEQPGRIRVFPNERDVESAPVFLDIKSKVRMRHNEEGLLALAFHPEYETNGKLYVSYSASDPRRGVVSCFKRSADDPMVADPESEVVILEVEQPYGNHNGCTLLFGPDGFLYASFGDGGYANDPHGHGQDTQTLLGAIIRIDVDRGEGDRAYAIPADNPFVGDPDVRDEIWAYGLRNVWRMSFDPATGDLWAGDVGQVRWEEIDLIQKGGNYGWNLREGRHLFREGEARSELIEPVWEYGRDNGISVTGGHVYRGKANPGLQGAYIFGDYVTGRIWALRYDGETVTEHWHANPGAQRRHISSFGVGPDGELYICTFDVLDGRSSKGRIYQIREQ